VGIFLCSIPALAWGAIFLSDFTSHLFKIPFAYSFIFLGDNPIGQANISQTPQEQQFTALPKAFSASSEEFMRFSLQRFLMTILGLTSWPIRKRGHISVHILHWIQADFAMWIIWETVFSLRLTR